MESDDAAVLRDLLAFLSDNDDPEHTALDAPVPVEHTQLENVLPQPEARGARQRRPRRATTAKRKEGISVKRTLDAARNEALALSAQLTRLRAGRASGYFTTMELTLGERRKRQRAEDECRQLREAVYRQTKFVRGLLGVVSATPRFSLSLDLCRYLHRHTRLPRCRSSRRGEYELMAHDSRMRAAIDVLCRETAAIAPATRVDDNDDNDDASFSADEAASFVHCGLLHDPDSRSTTAAVVYAVDTRDLGAVVRAVCVALRDIITICPSGHPLGVTHDVVDADAAAGGGNALYRVMRVRHRCAATGEEILVASHVVTSYELTTDYGLVVWDFVDDDALHPTPAAANITREITGACLVRRERGDDGVERTVVRSLGTKKFRFRDQRSADKLHAIACIVQPVDMVRGDEVLFRRIVLGQIAAEEALFTTSVV